MNFASVYFQIILWTGFVWYLVIGTLGTLICWILRQRIKQGIPMAEKDITALNVLSTWYYPKVSFWVASFEIILGLIGICIFDYYVASALFFGSVMLAHYAGHLSVHLLGDDTNS